MMDAPRLSSTWFDGHSPRAQACELRIEGDELVLTVDASERRYPVRQVRWAERRSHGQRQSELPDGSLIQHAEAGEWDAWRQASGQRDGAVVGWMQSWRATLVAMGATVLFLAAAWTWGVPWLSQTLAHQIPRSLEARLGEQGMRQLDRLFLQPSALPVRQQDALRARFKSAVERAHPQGDAPAWQLSFHRSKALGANAFALPGGNIVITDDLVKLLADQPEAIVGVLAHELGHVHHRHGLDLMVRASLVSALVGVVLGDASGFLATVPATLATQSYSRDAERAADAFAARLLDQSGVSPSVMVAFFERIQQQERPAGQSDRSDRGEDGAALPIAISSHPDHAERIRFFREWRTEPARP
ncbi:M48 family metallopeptidase [Hydrogenophaga sp.]|uniref:M48 family metallopeptidase n=1 Tax=Hydrogenophaga sp. TaxID=1904254 RepID=UPI00272FAF27|nr:M48 family metallopeptidase [Hydrogenophaga sp.]MDP2015406.1 M48 family metallopeptidase [Hydrogenophaga sp.]MDP3165477.1 M48 family metallopeptidase [Hydrogenophaga sp.]MDP3811497.1 M48 family metallopeptidase [Hydrogenophaga sp.]